MKLKGIYGALKNGYSLGCWSSGARIPIVSIIDKRSTTIASGEGSNIKKSFIEANSDWFEYLKEKVPFETRVKNKKNIITDTSDIKSSKSLFEWLDHWVKSGSGYLHANFNNYSDIFIVALDGYDENLNRVIQLGFDKDLLKAIEKASNAPKESKDK